MRERPPEKGAGQIARNIVADARAPYAFLLPATTETGHPERQSLALPFPRVDRVQLHSAAAPSRSRAALASGRGDLAGYGRKLCRHVLPGGVVVLGDLLIKEDVGIVGHAVPLHDHSSREWRREASEIVLVVATLLGVFSKRCCRTWAGP